MRIPKGELTYHNISCICADCLLLDTNLAGAQRISFGSPLYIYYYEDWCDGGECLKKIWMRPRADTKEQWKTIKQQKVDANDIPIS